MGKNKTSGNRKLVGALVVIMMALAFIGTWSYFAVYTPYYDAERDRLLTFTTHLYPTVLDPANLYDTDSITAVLNIFDRLVQYKKGTTEIEPGLATSWDIVDPVTYIFNLRQGVFFHDSTPFNASSVKFSLDRAANLDAPLSYIFYIINKTEILDTYKVRITLNENYAPFLQILSHPSASIVSQTAVEKYGDTYFLSNPVGTGPFKFDHWVPDKELVLLANNEYYNGAPEFQKVIFKVNMESSERLTQLVKGEVDANFGSTGISLQDLTVLQNNPDLQVYKRAGLGVEFLGLNLQRPPLNDTRVRQAIAYAIDYDSIIKDALGNVAERIGGPIPSSIFGQADLPLIQRDVSKARQLLTEAGYPNGFEIALKYNFDNLDRRKTAAVISSNLQDVGINVREEGLDWDSALEDYLAMDYDMCLNIWFPDYFDADGYLTPLFHSLSTPPDGFNIFGFSDPQVDKLIDQARTTTSQDVRLSAYKQAQERIVNEVPAVFLYVPDVYDVVRYNVANYVQSPTEYVYVYDMYRR